MRIESSVTSISWIPSEAVEGITKMPFEMGIAHYDDPPPDHIDSLDSMQEADASASPTSSVLGSRSTRTDVSSATDRAVAATSAQRRSDSAATA